MAEVYKSCFLVKNISAEDCYLKAMQVAQKTMSDFVLWKKRPAARLFGLKKKDDDFSTINFFLVTKPDGVEIEVRFNTKNYSQEELEQLFLSFKNEILKCNCN